MEAKGITRSLQGAGMLLALLLASAAAPTRAAGQAANGGNGLAEEGFDHFYNLEYDPAIAIFRKLRDGDPGNPYWQHRLGLAYLYKQLHVAGVLGGDLFDASNKFFRTKKIQTDPALVGPFRTANEAAVRLCEQHLKRNAKDEQALYSCGVAYAARATYQGLVERSFLDSLGSARKGNDYHTRLVRLNPRHYDAYLLPGLYDFVLGSLPGPLKVLLFFAGLSGDKDRGVQMVGRVAAWGNSAKPDAQLLLAVMYRREKRYADARRVLAELEKAFPRNYIVPLEIASIHRAAGEEAEAIREYGRVLEDVFGGKAGFSEAPVARIHYELGALYRKTGDLESARAHLRQVEGSQGSNPELEQDTAVLLQDIAEQLRQREAATQNLPAT